MAIMFIRRNGDNLHIGCTGKAREIVISKQVAQDICTSIITPDGLPRAGMLSQIGQTVKVEAQVLFVTSDDYKPCILELTPFVHHHDTFNTENNEVIFVELELNYSGIDEFIGTDEALLMMEDIEELDEQISD